MQTTAGRVLCEHVSVVGVSTSTPDTDESDEDWMDALAEAVDSMVGADSGDTPYVDGEYEIAPADKRFAGGVPKVIPPILKDMDSDSQRVKVLMQWLEDLPEGVASLNGVVVGVGKYGVGIFATEDLPPDHVALRINTSRVVTTTQCEAWANRYHSLGQVLAALEPRSLGDGRWSPRCSRATKLSIYLIAERALFMAHFNSSPAHDIPNELKQGHLSALNTAGSPETPRAKVSYVRSTAPPTVTGSNAPVGYVASLPGFGAMTPAVSVLRLKPGQTAHFSVGRHSLVGLGSGPSPQLSTEQDDSRRAEECASLSSLTLCCIPQLARPLCCHRSSHDMLYAGDCCSLQCKCSTTSKQSCSAGLFTDFFHLKYSPLKLSAGRWAASTPEDSIL